jgi:hypothetical protein
VSCGVNFAYSCAASAIIPGGRALETVGQLGVLVGLRRLELRERQAGHHLKVSALEPGALELGPPEVSPLEVGALEVGEACVGALQVHLGQPLALEVCANNVQQAREPLTDGHHFRIPMPC